MLTPPTILITGATGFAGGHLIERLAGAGTLMGWGRSAPRRDVAGLATWQTIDLLDRVQVRAAIADIRPTAVYHLAGASQVGESWQDTATPLEGNVLATAHLFDAIRRARLGCRVLVTGSASIYAPAATPLAETAPQAPANPYALSKLAQDQLSQRALADEGIDVVVTRPFNHTGPRQGPAFVAPALARQIAMIERGLMPPVIRVGNLDAIRDFTDVRDVVRAYVDLMEHGEAGEVYNIGSGIGRTIGTLLEALLARTAASIRVETDPARLRPVETSALVADAARLRTRTGWTPMIPFEQTLDDLLAYWRQEVQQPG